MCLPWPTLPGTGPSEQVFIGQVPEEGCHSLCGPPPCQRRAPHQRVLFTRELGMPWPMALLLEGHEEEVTATSILLRNDCCLPDSGSLLSVGWDAPFSATRSLPSFGRGMQNLITTNFSVYCHYPKGKFWPLSSGAVGLTCIPQTVLSEKAATGSHGHSDKPGAWQWSASQGHALEMLLWTGNLALLPATCVTLGKLVNLSEPRFLRR